MNDDPKAKVVITALTRSGSKEELAKILNPNTLEALQNHILEKHDVEMVSSIVRLMCVIKDVFFRSAEYNKMSETLLAATKEIKALQDNKRMRADEAGAVRSPVNTEKSRNI